MAVAIRGADPKHAHQTPSRVVGFGAGRDLRIQRGDLVLQMAHPLGEEGKAGASSFRHTPMGDPRLGDEASDMERSLRRYQAVSERWPRIPLMS